jgi:hypothetical protein
LGSATINGRRKRSGVVSTASIAVTRLSSDSSERLARSRPSGAGRASARSVRAPPCCPSRRCRRRGRGASATQSRSSAARPCSAASFERP